MPRYFHRSVALSIACGASMLALPTTAQPREPSAAEQYMLELTNRARANPWAEAVRLGVPGGNPNEGLSTPVIPANASYAPLAMNLNLVSVARSYSQAVLDADARSTHFLNNTIPGPRMRAGGYNAVQNMVAENMALSWSAQAIPTVTEQWVDRHHRNLFLDTGLAGRGHRMTILTTTLREVGIGYALATGYTAYSSTNTNGILVTQDFGLRSAPTTFLTGVVYDDSVNRNSFYNIGEGLGGIQVNVYAPMSTTLVASTTTWGSGGYTIAMAPGLYEVEFRQATSNQAVRSNIFWSGSNSFKLDAVNPFNAPVGPARGIFMPSSGVFDDVPLPPVAEVPEPATWALMGLGVLLLAGAARRRSGASAAA